MVNNMIPLGIRLNNPANIRYNHLNHWKGQLKPVNGFCKFTDTVYGIRALLVTLRTYFKKYKLTTVSSIISRYAPPTENDTENYIDLVLKHLNMHFMSPFSRETSLVFNFNTPDVSNTLFYLCVAICVIESGYKLTYDEFSEALNMI